MTVKTMGGLKQNEETELFMTLNMNVTSVLMSAL